ncbi:MAG: hypothetical protein ACXABH_13585 [Candidatus Thorarchaeota archaeon]
MFEMSRNHGLRLGLTMLNPSRTGSFATFGHSIYRPSDYGEGMGMVVGC